MDPVTHFGTITNFVISVVVTLYGLIAWLRDRDLGTGPHFRHLVYRYWWASWSCWVFAWGVLLMAALTGSEVSIGLKIVTLVFDNLNSVFMILVYFVITRGDHFDKPKIHAAFKQIAGSLALGCIILYLLSPVITVGFAYDVHRTWSLCLGVFAPMLIGWACHLRYNTLLVLDVGSAYGFMQPIIYATELTTVQSSLAQAPLLSYKPVVAMILGGLKVLFAVVFMQVLVHGSSTGGSLIANKTTIRFRFFRRWEKKVLGHALVLGSAYCCLLIALVGVYADGLRELATGLGIVGGFMALLDWFWKLWEKGSKKQ
jgi:hypothetical protein